MSIKFDKTADFKNAKQDLVNAMNDESITKEQREEVLNTYVASLSETIENSVLETVSNQHNDARILADRGNPQLTSKEFKFFNEVVQDGLFNDDEVLPITTIERVFDDLEREHPLLKAIGVQNLGPVTKMIRATPEGLAVWGNLFDGIKGQVNANVNVEDFIQLKLTAFGAIPDDMLELGPVWVERYMRTLLVEVLSTGLENGFVNGRGPNQKEPIGLTKDVDADTGNVTDKSSKGELKLIDSERGAIIKDSLKKVVKDLAKNAKGEARKVAGRVALIVNPFDAIELNAAATHQNVNGVYVTAMPFGVEVIESDLVEEGKAIAFVKGEYLAAVGGGYKLKKFDQTLAMEDAHLYTIKTYAYGMPLDNQASAIYDLTFNEIVEG